MSENEKQRQMRYARRNLRVHVFCKVFMKRVFLLLSAIHFVDVAGLSLRE